MGYLREVREEFRKVTWPTGQQTLQYTLAVIGVCLVTAVYFGALDWVLNQALEALVVLTS